MQMRLENPSKQRFSVVLNILGKVLENLDLLFGCRAEHAAVGRSAAATAVYWDELT